MQSTWSGVFPAVTTKFNADSSLDIQGMKDNFQAQIDAGVDGMIVIGSLGENAVLSFDEKLTVLSTALEVADGKIPVLACVAENTTAEGCHFIKEGVAAGADGFMALPGMRYISDRRETLQHFTTLADASEKPLMIYNNPVAYGVDTTPEMFAELAAIENIVAIKESSDDVRRVTDLINEVGDRYQIFCGVDNLAMESQLMGAAGWVAGLVCAFPRETVVIYQLVKAGRIDEALVIYRWFAPLLKLDVSTKLVQNIKLAEAMVGLGTEHVRAPRLPLVGDERETVQAIIQRQLDCRPELPAL